MIGFFGCVYVGRYFSMMLGRQLTKSNNLLAGLAVIIAISLLWLFIHADFPLEKMPALNMLLFWLPAILLSIGTGMLLKLVRLNISALDEAQLNVATRESELRLLQSQLSPHFLFNTLNNLYGISMTRHEQVPGLLLKLSELLRYGVYDAKSAFVPLKEEIAYIQNYIDFEKIRLGERLQLKVSLETDGVDHWHIAPMLLIVFVENAFKHARNSTDDHIYIDMSLKTWANSILFSLRNSFQVNSGSEIRTKHSGLGLENAQRRLELLYPDAYDLDVQTADGFYHVMLQLKAR
jgi:LytS/YehU family sensor histidine kinase